MGWGQYYEERKPWALGIFLCLYLLENMFNLFQDIIPACRKDCYFIIGIINNICYDYIVIFAIINSNSVSSSVL